ncbi:MAG TPA: flagellum-specific ATP synthase FliI, partial [Burkholderiaceae bacterium]
LTVLVEGDDMNEPIADCLRATLDGHIVLSRRLAQQAHYPAIDLLHSASRVMSDIVPTATRALAIETMATLALIEQYRQMVDIGAYVAGSNPALDRALALRPALTAFLRQADGGERRDAALAQLATLLKGAP